MKQITLLILLSTFGFSQQYNFQIYNTSNSEISFNGVSDIEVDSEGNLWLASYYNTGGNGISMFDGENWINYNISNSSIPTNAITDIEIDSFGNKWIATWQIGLIVFDGENWINYNTSNSSIPTNQILQLKADSEGSIWMITETFGIGLIKFDGEQWITYNTSNSNIPSNAISSLAIDSNNFIWFTTNGFMEEGQLVRFDGNYTWEAFTTPLTSPDNFFRDELKIDNQNNKWISAGYGFLKFDGSNWEYKSYFEDGNIMDCQVEALDFDLNNNLWVGYFTECNSGGLQNFSQNMQFLNSNSDLPENDIADLKIIDNIIWIGTYYGGLVKLTIDDLSTTELSNPKITIYPNPAKEFIIVINNNQHKSLFSYKIYDLSGKLMSSGEALFNQPIQTGFLTKGSYLISIEQENIISNKKILIN